MASRASEAFGTGRVVLNVGGVRYETSETTLRAPHEEVDSVLGMLVRRAQVVSDPAELSQLGVFGGGPVKFIFIDRNGALFSVILEYLRTGEVSVPHGHTVRQVIGEAEYFGLTALVSQLGGSSTTPAGLGGADTSDLVSARLPEVCFLNLPLFDGKDLTHMLNQQAVFDSHIRNRVFMNVELNRVNFGGLPPLGQRSPHCQWVFMNCVLRSVVLPPDRKISFLRCSFVDCDFSQLVHPHSSGGPHIRFEACDLRKAVVCLKVFPNPSPIGIDLVKCVATDASFSAWLPPHHRYLVCFYCLCADEQTATASRSPQYLLHSVRFTESQGGYKFFTVSSYNMRFVLCNVDTSRVATNPSNRTACVCGA